MRAGMLVLLMTQCNKTMRSKKINYIAKRSKVLVIEISMDTCRS